MSHNPEAEIVEADERFALLRAAVQDRPRDVLMASHIEDRVQLVREGIHGIESAMKMINRFRGTYQLLIGTDMQKRLAEEFGGMASYLFNKAGLEDWGDMKLAPIKEKDVPAALEAAKEIVARIEVEMLGKKVS